MHPAYSVIFFTTASGAGLGLMVWLGLVHLFGLLPATPLFGYVAMGLALALLSLGLMSSTFHLGRPERAWRAFSQWRSSWLSREGVAASATYLPALVFAAGYGGSLDDSGFVHAAAGVLMAALALVTLYTTGMIYASLPTIPAWNQPLTAPGYIVLGLASGAVLMTLVLAVFGAVGLWAVWIAITALAAGWGLKRRYWTLIDVEPPRQTIGEATGLGQLGRVSQVDPPHTMANFVMREMGFQVARRHACRLRHIALVAGFVVPAVLVVLMLVAGPTLDVVLAVLAVLVMAAGFVTERWLFFAEGRHVSMLYYGHEAV